MEVEFVALDKCAEQAEYLRQFLEDIPRWPKHVTAIEIVNSLLAEHRAQCIMETPIISDDDIISLDY